MSRSYARIAAIPVHIEALDGLNLDAVSRKKIMSGNAGRLLNMTFN